tara:strand:+ start:239 stop:655 length:417 start_codon:yes stop_codon:yes gene_type:complete
MATTLAQVLQRLDAVLRASAPAGTTIFRGRADALARSETPSINVKLGSHSVEPQAGEMDVHTVMVELQLSVRDDDVLLAAEALHEAVHRPVMTDAQLLALVDSIRHVDADGDPEPADETSLTKVARYRLIYSRLKTTL